MARTTSPTAAALPRRPNAIPIGKMCAKSRESRLRSAEEEVERIVQEYLRERQQKMERQDQELQRRSHTPRRIKLVINRRGSRGSSQASSSSQGSP